MRSRPVVRLLLTLVAATTLVAGACGDSGRSPEEVVLAASSETIEAKSSRVAFSMRMTGVQGIETGEVTVGGEGAMDYSKGVGSFSMTLPPIGGVELGRIDAILIGTVMYQRFPPELAKELGGKPWIKIDLAEIGKLVGVDIGALAQSQSSDPTQAMALLRGASSDVTVVGTENLRGEDTTHYKATLDPRKAAAAAPEQQRKALEQVAEMYQGITIPADVWIDGANRLRKMTYVVDLSKLKLPPEAATSLPDGTMNLTMELFEFGVPVTADPPPADQVLDLIELMERAGAQG